MCNLKSKSRSSALNRETRSTMMHSTEHSPPLLKLPPEIFELIAKHVSTQDLKSLRLANRECADKTQKTFREVGFAELTFLLYDEESLNLMCEIASHRVYGPAVKKITLLLNELPGRQWVNPRNPGDVDWDQWRDARDAGDIACRVCASNRTYEYDRAGGRRLMSIGKIERWAALRATQEKLQRNDFEAGWCLVRQAFTSFKQHGKLLSTALDDDIDAPLARGGFIAKRLEVLKDFGNLSLGNICDPCNDLIFPGLIQTIHHCKLQLKSLAVWPKEWSILIDRPDTFSNRDFKEFSSQDLFVRLSTVLSTVENFQLSMWSGIYSTSSQAVDNLCAVIGAAPNLRSLQVHLRTDSRIRDQIIGTYVYPYDVDIGVNAMRSLLEQSFTKLHSLELSETGHWDYLNLDQVLAFLARHPALERLSLRDVCLEDDDEILANMDNGVKTPGHAEALKEIEEMGLVPNMRDWHRAIDKLDQHRLKKLLGRELVILKDTSP